jgi:DNA polymerase elongation subunit (family B)
MSTRAALCKIEKTTHNGETIYNFFVRDESRRRHHVSVYDYYPYFYVPETTPIIKHPDYIKTEKGNFKDLNGKPVKKIYMKNWNTINPYDDQSYHKKYRKSYEADVDQENRIAIDLGIKSGLEFDSDIIVYNEDHLKPVDCKVNLRRLHIDYEVSTEITKKVPTYNYPVEPMYTLANFDNYTQKFVIFIQHQDYKNKTFINTTYRPPIKKALIEKIKELKSKLEKLRIQYKECIDIEKDIIGMSKEQLVENGDYVIYLFRRIKFEKELKSFISRLKAIKNQFKDTYPVKIVMYDNEVDMYKRYIQYVNDLDPDIITGWNSQEFDIPYLLERMKEVGVRPNKLSPIRSVYINKSQNIGKIKGRIVFDSWKGFKKQQTHLLESYSLDFVSKYLFNIGKQEHNGIDNMYHNDRKLLIKYNLQDVFLEFAIFENQGIFEFFYDIKCYAGCSFEDVLDNSHIVDIYCLFRSKKLGLVLPNKPNVDYVKFPGAPIPFPPKRKGIQEYIAVIDLKSLYPNIMRTLNIGADTIVQNPTKEMIPNLIRSPINGLYFRKDKKSFIGGISEKLLEYREVVKAEMKAAFNSGDLALFELKKRLQTVIKFITNSIWGVIGWNKFRLYHRDSARCITATARLVIQFSGKIAAKKGFIPYYGDTDSVFLMMKPKPVIEIKRDMINLAGLINKRYEIFKKIFNVNVHYFKMIAEKLFKHCFMVEKKKSTKITKPEDAIARKRYVGWLIWNDDLKLEESCNELSITGFDRSDMSRVGNKTMKEMLLLSASGITSKVQEYLKEKVNKIKKQQYLLEDVAFSKGISKPLDEYGDKFWDWIEGAKWTNYHSGLWGGLTNYGATSKPKYVYVTKTKVPKHYEKIPNKHKFMVIALDGDNSLPNELIKAIDWKTLIEKTIRDKIIKILDAADIDWSDIFDYEGYEDLLRC